MLKPFRKQRGITFPSLVGLLVLLGFVLMIFIKLFPGYMESFKVESALNGLVGNAGVEGASDGELRQMIIRKLQVDDVEWIKPELIKIEKQSRTRKVWIEYEYRVHMMSNVDAILMIGENAVEVPL